MVRETETSDDVTNYIVAATVRCQDVQNCFHCCYWEALWQSNPLFSLCQHELLLLADRISVFWVVEGREIWNLKQRDCVVWIPSYPLHFTSIMSESHVLYRLRKLDLRCFYWIMGSVLLSSTVSLFVTGRNPGVGADAQLHCSHVGTHVLTAVGQLCWCLGGAWQCFAG